MAKRTRVHPARKETSVKLDKITCLLAESLVNGNRFQNSLQKENLRAIKKLSSTNFFIAHIPPSSSKTTAVLTCSTDQQLSNSKGFIIHQLHLTNLQDPHTTRYDFTSSPTEGIPFSLTILESSNLITK